MHSGWVRWIAYLVLASLVVVTSCQAWAGDVPGIAQSTTIERTVVPDGAQG